MRLRFIVLVVLSTFILSSCATLFNTTSPTLFQARSIPEGAKVTATALNAGTEVFTATTPATLSLSKNLEYELVFELEGYRSKSLVVRRTINGWFWGNLLIGGIPGWIVDGATGAMWSHEINEFTLDFTATSFLPDGSFVASTIVQYLELDGMYMHVKIPVIFEPI